MKKNPLNNMEWPVELDLILEELCKELESDIYLTIRLTVGELKQLYFATNTGPFLQLAARQCPKARKYQYIRDVRADRYHIFSKPALGVSPPAQSYKSGGIFFNRISFSESLFFLTIILNIMKSIINKTQKFVAIRRVLENHDIAFEGKPEALAAREDFVTKSSEITDLLAKVIQPVTSVYVERKENRKGLKQMLHEMIHIGIMLARRKQDNTLLHTFNNFNRQMRSVPGPLMLEISQYVLNKLSDNEAIATDLGLTAADKQAFEDKYQSFEQALLDTQNKLDERRIARLDINQLIKECNAILRLELDRFVRYNQRQYPAMANNYLRLRRAKRKRNSNKLPTDSEIMGHVRNALTNEPIAGATLNLIEHGWAISTNNEGHYLFDELKPGHFTVSCHAAGYQVPEPLMTELETNDSVVFDFMLTPLASPGSGD